jgi:Ca2+-binding RTX toxin-like protein
MSKQEDGLAASMLVKESFGDFASGRSIVVYFAAPNDSPLLQGYFLPADHSDYGINRLGDTSQVQSKILQQLDMYVELGIIKPYQISSSYSSNVDIVIGVSSFSQAKSSAGKLGATISPNLDSSDSFRESAILFDDSLLSNNDPDISNMLIFHEIAHALGLKDVHTVGLTGRYDSYKYSSMSYKQHPSLSATDAPTSLMLLDYLAFQQQGVLSDYDPKDEYTWGKDEKVLHTIYDTGGENVISAQDHERNTIIDLREGHFSSYGKSDKGNEVPVENLAIAYGTIIKNAIGGKGHDVLIGNDTGNELTGGKGDDILTGGGSPLTTADWQFFTKYKGYLPMVDGATGSVTDNDTLMGGEGNDHLYGIMGNDKLDGEDGHDFLYGGKGDDTLIGGKGVDRLEGGDGKDTYIFDGDFGRDIIVDSDGKGAVVIDGVTLGELTPVKGTENVFRFGSNIEVIRFEEGKTTSLFISTRPTATSSGSSVMIKNWQPDQLGITLGALDEEPSIPGVIVFNGDAAGNVLSMDHALYVYEDDPSRNSWRHLQADGGAGQDFLMGTLSGNDTLKGGDDDDIILGGSVILGETNVRLLSNLDNHGTDEIDGGDGSDYIVVTGKNSVAHGGDDNDFIRADSAGVGWFSDVYGYDESGNRIMTVTTDQVWQDYRQNFAPRLVETEAEGSVTFELSLFDLANNSLDWGVQPSVSSETSYVLQRPINNVDKSIVLITAYGDIPPEIALSPGSTVGDWYLFSGGAAGKTEFESYWGDSTIDIAKYQDMKGQNLFGDKGDDVIYGGIMSDYIVGGEDNDTLFGFDGHDIIDGGTGVDHIRGGTGNDTIMGGDNDDVIYGNGFPVSPQQTSLPDNDVLFGGDGDDELHGGDGDDYLEGGSGRDKFHGGKGNDTIVATLDDYYVQDEEGDDVIIIESQVVPEPAFASKAGSTASINKALNSKMTFSAAATAATDTILTISDNVGNNTLALVGVSDFSGIGLIAVGNDLVLNNNGGQIYVSNGLNGSISNYAVGASQEDFINKSSSVKNMDVNSLLLSNLSTAVTRTALVENTDLVGGLNIDRLTAHAAGSTLIGGKGNDTLLGGVGDDTYFLRLGDGQDSLTEKGGNNKIKLAEGITTDQVSLRRSGSNLILMISSGESITVNGMFNASTGEVIESKAIQSVEFFGGDIWDAAQIQLALTKGVNLIATNSPETLLGFENNDTLSGGAGADVLYGRDGNDLLLGGEGNDSIRGESGQDVLDGGAGEDSLEGGDGEDNLMGGSGNDTLLGGIGNDTLDGGSGNDRLVGQAGNDIYLFGKGDGLDEISSGGTNFGLEDILIFKDGVSPADIKLMKSGYGRDLKMIIVSTGESITVKDYFYAAENTILKKVVFTDTTEWDSNYIAANVAFATSGNDVLLGDLGADNLSGSDGDDILTGGEGNDTLSGGNGIDTLIGGNGNDMLSGNGGMDVYVFNVGDGQDTISEYSDENISNSIVFGEGIAQDDIKLGRKNNDLILVIGHLGDQITIESFYKKSSSLFENRNFNLIFVDGSVSLRDFHSNAVIDTFFTTEIGEQIFGTPGNDLIFSLGGNDSVYAGSGNDTLIGGQGNDKLFGSDGLDTFVFNVGDGQDTIENGGGSLTEYDKIMLGEGIVRDNIMFARSNDDLIMLMGTPDDQIRIAQYFRGDIETRKAYEVHFADADELIKLEALLNISNTTVLPPTEFTDQFYGFNGDDLLRGLGGSDYLYGEGGNDTIIGGAGDDRLFGGSGFNTYVFNQGDGEDYINLNAVTSSFGGRIIFEESILQEDIRFSIGSYAIGIHYGATDAVYIAIPQLGETGFAVTREEGLNAVAGWELKIGSEVSSLGDLIDAAPSVDAYVGSYNLAYGQDYFGTAWNDIMDKSLSTRSADLYGGLGNDVLVGGKYKDYLYGELGNDTLDGGLGNDWLTGGDGDDIYKYDFGSGNDQIFERSGHDKVDFGIGILPHEVVVSRSGIDGRGSDLVFTFTNGEFLTIKYVFDTNTGAIDQNNIVEEFRFADSSIWTFEQSLNLIAGDDLIPPHSPSASIDSSGLVVQGFAEAGSLVEIKNENDVVLGYASAEVATGSYSVTLSTALINNERIKITAKDAAGNVSPASVINAPDYTPPSNPSGNFITYPGQEQLSVSAEAGSYVEVRSDSGELLGRSDIFQYSGYYSTIPSVTLTNGEAVHLVAIDAAGNVSAPTTVIAPDNTAPLQPTAVFDLNGKVIAGIAEAGSTVIVKNSAGIQLKNTIADAVTGAYTITLTAALINKETVNVTAKDAAGNISVVKALVAPDLTAPAIPSASIDTAGKTITGTAEKGSTIAVKNADGVELKSAVANTSTGAYTITLSTALINNESLSIVAKDAAGNISGEKIILAPDKTAPIAPTASFDSAGKVITGIAEIGSVVTVKNSEGTILKTTTANVTTGVYTITLGTALTNKEIVNVFASDAAGNVSAAFAVVAPDVGGTADPTPTSIIIQTENYTAMSGVKNQNTSDVGGGQNTGYIDTGDWMAYSNVAFNVQAEGRYKVTYRVASLNGGGRLTLKELNSDSALGSITVPKTAGWQKWVDVTQEITLSGGEHNFKLAADIGGFNINWFKLELLESVTPDTTPPAQPTAEFDSQGKVITGVAEAGSIVAVKNADNTNTLGTVTAHATTGAYLITLGTALINSETINVSAIDAAGNASTIKAIIAPDKTAPNAPTANLDIALKTVSGIAEVGSSVVVKNLAGQTLGVAQADATSGVFIVEFTQALINGESIFTTATDSAGNISTVTTTPVIIDADPAPLRNGLRGSYFGYHQPANGNVNLTNLAQVLGLISSGTPDATFIAKDFQYGSPGATALGMGLNLQNFLKMDASSLSRDPDNTSDAILRFDGKVHLDAGSYNFRVKADDGYSVRINGVAVAEYELNQSATTRIHAEFTVMESGLQDIEIIYWDSGWDHILNIEIANSSTGIYKYLGESILFQPAIAEPVAMLAEASMLKTDYESLQYLSSNDALIQAMASFVSESGVDTRYRPTNMEQGSVMIAVGS